MVYLVADLNTGQRYRIFAGKGNTLSEDGVSVVMNAMTKSGHPWEVTVEFWTRQDAVKFFRHCTEAAETCSVGKAGDEGTLMAEDAALPWKYIEKDEPERRDG